MGFPLRTEGPSALTVLHMLGAGDLGDCERRTREWAAAVWCWSGQHELIRAALRSVLESART